MPARTSRRAGILEDGTGLRYAVIATVMPGVADNATGAADAIAKLCLAVLRQRHRKSRRDQPGAVESGLRRPMCRHCGGRTAQERSHLNNRQIPSNNHDPLIMVDG